MPTEFQTPALEDPLHRRIRMHAERINLSSPETGTADFKTYMVQENEILARYHRQGQSGLRVARLRSMVMDVLIENLAKRAMTVGKIAEGNREFDILALGGYGREEMCPYSDVDIMFFYPSNASEASTKTLQQALTDGVLYPLWDLGFKVGHSSRNMEQVLEEARQSVESKNALLEARLITGSQTLWKNFQREYSSFVKKGKIGKYIEERLEAENTRHEKYGDTIFLQEPDIKNGVGGLRDYQNAIWMARLKLGITSVNDLGDIGYLNKTEQQEFAAAYDFLLRVRTELHMQLPRASDLLDLEKQTQVAWYLGYRYRDIMRRVEYFMHDYYRNCDVIRRISAYLQYKIAQDSRKKKLSFGDIIPYKRPVQVNDGFVIKDGTIKPANEQVFAEDPERLIRVFRHAQQAGATIDIELQRMIRNDAGLIDKRIINSPGAAKSFLAIMQQPGEVFQTLNLMNECGVLEMYIPEWKNMHCLVQHEFYHRFTADYHTLKTIRELDFIFTSPEDRTCAPYLHELRESASPTLPYIALLLHDIGKGLGISGHAHRGAEIAKTILARLGYNADLSAKIIDIIERHLDMARFWQRFDVEDPQTSQSFAKVITDEDTLRYLYVLTYCDAKGTSDDLWNSYKNALHRDLFKSTLAILAGQRVTHTPEAMIPKELIREKLPEISEDEIEAHYNLLPERYFIYNNVDEIALHIKMVNELLHRISEADSIETLIPIVHWQDDLSLSMTVVNIVTWDRSGLFYKLSGAFSVAGLSIVSSKAITRADHITVDTFYVCDASGGIVQNKNAHATVEKYLKKALARNEDLMTAIEEQEHKIREGEWTRARTPAAVMRTPITPSVGVYHELSLKHTIVELQCEDRIGLLYNVSKAIFEYGFDITFARIATERGVAMDTFYIEPIDKKTIDGGNLLPLREKLSAIISRKPRDSGMENNMRKIAQ
jgi:[protein-PII] uridylyltransferase